MEQFWVLKVVQKLECFSGDDKNVLIAKMEQKVEQFTETKDGIKRGTKISYDSGTKGGTFLWFKVV